ncbi:MAG: trehalose-phosphatase, partial [Halanaerobiales bacterium]
KRYIEMAIISGRNLQGLLSMIEIPDIIYAGNHGMEIKTAEGEVIYPAAEKQSSNTINKETAGPKKNGEKNNPVKKKIKKYFQHLSQIKAGFRLEDKGFALGLHYPPDYNINDILIYLEEITAGTNYSILPGRQVIEIRPAGWNKGKTARLIINRILPEKNSNRNGTRKLIIYIGDDTTDEDAFRELDGINIYVKNEGNLETEAGYYLRNPEEVLKFLKIIKTLH